MGYNPYRFYDPMGDELYHYGILGMKWGIRRYENPDGTLTEEGKRRYYSMSPDKLSRTFRKRRLKKAGKYETETINKYNNLSKEAKEKYRKQLKEYNKKWDRLWNQYDDLNADQNEWKRKSDALKAKNKKMLDEVHKYSLDEVWESNRGYSYSGNYLKGRGRDIRIAQLMDAGFNKKTAEELTDLSLKGYKKDRKSNRYYGPKLRLNRYY